MEIPMSDHEKLLAIFNNTPELDLDACQALDDSTATPGAIFPSFDTVDQDEIIGLVIQIREYTDRCWQGTQRLKKLSACALDLPVEEFGV
jgi:hypothetical protein